jgi:hypothetical protein
MLIIYTYVYVFDEIRRSRLFEEEPSEAAAAEDLHPVHLDLSAESAAIQQCFSFTTNQRTVLLAR